MASKLSASAQKKLAQDDLANAEAARDAARARAVSLCPAIWPKPKVRDPGSGAGLAQPAASAAEN